jgi:hypothetical protein
MGFEVSATLRIHIVIFWAVTSSAQEGRYKNFDGTCCLHDQGSTNVTLVWPANRNYQLLFNIARGKAIPGETQRVPEG